MTTGTTAGAEHGSVCHRLTAATRHLDPPLAALDVAALHRNAADLVRRAGGRPIRVASKSVRCRWVLDELMVEDGFSGVMAYSLAEALWLARSGMRDVLIGYPTVDRAALAQLLADPALRAAITLMVDDPAQLTLIASVAGWPGATEVPVRLCLDVDASLRIGRLHLGVRRSPLREPEQAAALVRAAHSAGGFEVVGVMFYEAQIAGLPDRSPAVRLVKRRSAAELVRRRAAVVSAVQAAGARLSLVNSGGTGSLEISAADPVVTEVTAGSGLYAPTLFDGYRAFQPDPALFFALPVVRRPAPRIVTAFGGGYVASGPASRSRLPSPVLAGLKLLGTEGAGEVQTPLKGPAARDVAVGDRVWLRHAKAGELLERFDSVHLVAGSEVVDEVPSYRGEGQNFG
ncbi:MAG: alanine racemase domain protein [Frankiales bacterium]|nr:alanine racemase domain protein [Frankiales bacterium]